MMNALQMKIDAVIIATDVQEGVAGSQIRDRHRLHIDGYPASMEFMRQYYRCGKNSAEAGEYLNKINTQILPMPNSGPFLLQYLLRKGFEAELVTFFSLERDRLIGLLREKPKAVVISTTLLPFTKQIEKIALWVKDRAPESVIIAGGIQIWKSFKIKRGLELGRIDKDFQKYAAKDHYLINPCNASAVDILVVSDRGEHTLTRLLQKIRDGRDYTGLPNIAYFADGQWRINPIQPEPVELDSIDWGSMGQWSVDHEIPISAGTGCLFHCSFCDFHSLRPWFRRPVGSVIAEIRSIPLCNGKRSVFFTDDNLFFSVRQARELCQALIDADLSLRWRSFVRADAITDETAGLMAESGCRELLIGVETGDPGLLEKMAKNTTPEKILEAINKLNICGINTQSTLIVGFPGETDQTLKNTIDLLNAYSTAGPAIHTFYPFLFMIAPLMPIASSESRRTYQLTGYMDNWSHCTMNSQEASKAIGKLYDAVKMELSPIYHGERLVDWLSPDDLKRAIFFRNKLQRIQCGKLPQDDEAASWKELERIFSRVRT